MIVLGINTSTREGSIALMEESRLIAEYTLNVQATHSERLLPSLDRLLGDAGIGFAEVGGIAVAIGPGSFTGLRIGLASAKGLAMAASLPVWGIPTLEALARNLPFCGPPICPMLHARKTEVFWALYRFAEGRWSRVEEEAASSIEWVAGKIQEETVFLGDGAVLYAEGLKRLLGSKALFPPVSLMHIRASQVAEMGLERAEKGERDDLAALVPRYVRRSEAEIRWNIQIGD